MRHTMKAKHQRGFSLQSTLLSALVCGSIISVCLQSVKPILLNSNWLAARIKENERLNHVAGLISLMTREIDYHRHQITPRILKRGEILYTNGDRLSLAANPDSDAVASITFKGDEAFVIHHFISNKLFGCFRGDARPATETDFLLGISPDGERLFKGSKEIGGNRCDEFSIAPIPSLVLSEVEINPSTIRIIYPVSREYLLYVTSQSELKFLSVQGKEIKEHQPLERGIHNMLLSKQEINLGKLFIFSLTVEGTNKTLSLPFSHALVRAPSFVELFNL